MKEKKSENISTKKGWRIVFLVILMSWITFNVFAKKPCGKLLGGFDENCVVVRNEDQKEQKAVVMMDLYPYDLIIQQNSVQKIILSLSPFARRNEIHQNAIWIVYDPPENKNQAPKFPSWLKNLKRAIRTKYFAVTKEAIDEKVDITKMYPKPGRRASLFPGESILFCWESRLAKSFVVKDHNGSEVFRKKINSETSLELNVKDIGINPFLTYHWGIEVEGIVGIRTDYEIKLLDNDIMDMVGRNFGAIEKEKINPLCMLLRKAAYLQFISDNYRGNVDLYWKCGEMLIRIDPGELAGIDKEYQDLYKLLLLNYKNNHEQK